MLQEQGEYFLKNQFIFVVEEKSAINFIISELYNNDSKIIQYNYKEIESPFLIFLRSAHLMWKINKFIRLPFQSIWATKFEDITWNKETQYYIIFNAFHIRPISVSYLKRLQAKYNIKYILYLADNMGGVISEILKKYHYLPGIRFDYIFTFDFNDAQKYGYICYPVPYSVLPDKKIYDIKYDLYYVGSNNGRLAQMLDIYSYITFHKVEPLYRINKVKRSQQKFKDKIIYNKTCLYDVVVEEVKQSNCILEIIRSGQSGATLRYYEAVCYNKKLLTNNKNVVNLPFYDSRYMKVFEKPEDIDWAWVKERVPVDYHYDGRFSPTHFIDKIIELEEEKERKELGQEQTD